MPATDLALGIAIGTAVQPVQPQCILVEGRTYCPQETHAGRIAARVLDHILRLTDCAP